VADHDGSGNSTFNKLGLQRLTRRDFMKGATVLGAGVVLAPAIAACGGSSTSTSPAASAAASPVMGGRLRIGVIGGSVRDVVDLMVAYSSPDNLRGRQIFNSLFEYDHNFQLREALALEAEPNATGDVWTVKLRPDVTFHNGKSFTANDVVWTFKKILDPKFTNFAAEHFQGVVDPKGLKAIDDLTVQFSLLKPNADFMNSLAFIHANIKPEGYDPKNPVGTGPFSYGDFKPGDRSIFPAYKDFWGDGPYVDEVETIDFETVTAMVNALQGGELDAASDLPAAQVKVVEAAGYKTITSESGKWNYLFWNTTVKPFDDERVRQAMRLIMDRQQMVDLALEGYGRVGNDMWGIFDPAYPKDFAQRTQDIEQAKSLLKQAGQENLKFELLTAPVGTGAIESTSVFAEQAKAAGVTVTVKKLDVGTYWGDKYLTWPNGPGWYSARMYLSQARLCEAWNEPHWTDKTYWNLIDEAYQTVDDAKRNEIIREAYTIDYNIGAWDVWSWANTVDASTDKVHGLVPDASGIPYNSGYVNSVWLG
jgi:peptide/nickel transport system substrate-binding protein